MCAHVKEELQNATQVLPRLMNTQREYNSL